MVVVLAMVLMFFVVCNGIDVFGVQNKIITPAAVWT